MSDDTLCMFVHQGIFITKLSADVFQFLAREVFSHNCKVKKKEWDALAWNKSHPSFMAALKTAVQYKKGNS